MRLNKTRHSVVCVCSILTALVVAVTLFPLLSVRANPGPDSAATTATFRTKCVMCHGEDGGGSQVGKSLNVPDLRSPAVQKLPYAELAQIISDGKGGMPPFKSSLSEDQIHSMVKYVRSLGRKK